MVFFFQILFLWYQKFGKVLQILAKLVKFTIEGKNLKFSQFSWKKSWNHSLIDLHVKGHFTWQSKDQFEANWTMELDISSHF